MAAPEAPAAPPPSPVPLLGPGLALLQPWIDQVPRPQRRLGLFIAFALLAHLALFFFIRIDTTRAQFNPASRTHVTMQDGFISAAPADGFWDRLSDPRLFILPQQSFSTPLRSDPKVDFSALTPRLGTEAWPEPTAVRDGTTLHPAALPLDQKVAAQMRPMRQVFNYDERPAAPAPATAWEWSPLLAARQPVAPGPLPSPTSDTDLPPTQLRVAVDGDGTVAYALVEQGCGRLDLDQAAVLATRKVRFQSASVPGLQWGRAAIAWHYTAAPREIMVPTPPSSP